MKPSFALNLTEEGVTLLHRTARGWLDVGYAAFSDPDLPAALDYLRSTALGLSPKGLTTKLVIPNSQILYAQVDAPGPDEDSRRSQIETALQGLTPYEVADLVYDWKLDGTTAHVAVVARETLAEAEGFATEHRFNPLSFVAIPDLTSENAFEGEPFFGPSSLAPSLLSNKQTLQRDDDAIAIITREMPKDTPKAPKAAAPADDAASAAKKASSPPPDTVPVPEPAQTTVQLDTPEPGPEPGADVLPPTTPDPKGKTAAAQAPESAEARTPPAAPQVTSAPAHAKWDEPKRFEAPPLQSSPAQTSPAQTSIEFGAAPALPTTPTSKAPAPEVEEAPMAIDVPGEDEVSDKSTGKPQPGSADTSKTNDDLPPPLSPAALLAFSSRRGAEAPTTGRGAGVADAGLRGAGSATSNAPPVRATSAGPAPAGGFGGRVPGAKPAVDRPASARPAPKFSYDDPVPPPPRLPGDPPGPQSAGLAKAGKGLRNIGAMVSAKTLPIKTQPKPVGPDGAPINTTAMDVDTASNVATLRPKDLGPRPAQTLVKPDALAQGLAARAKAQPGKPRFLGLILTGILLLILAIVAAWSSYYLTQSTQSKPVAVVATDVPATTDATPADAALGDQANVTIAAPDAVVPEPEAVPPAAVAEPAPDTGVDTNATAAAPPANATQDEIVLAETDAPPAPPTLNEPLVLAESATTGDALPAPQMPPPPFGTVYKFDENGLIEPTKEGIISPEGVMLIAGKPARIPPQRPAAVEAAAAAVEPAALPAPSEAAVAAAPETTPSEPAAAADTAILPEQTFAADPSLAKARPRLRPAALAPATGAATADDAALAPTDGSGFVSLRPRVRPAAILAAGETARLASQSASLAANAAAEVAIVQASASVNPQGLQVSRIPAPRPRNLSRAVEAAVAAATRQQPATRTEPAPEPAPKGKVHDEADDEPEIATAAPRIPTRANVAKQATYVNAINLSKINLIGVYGSQSKRYALIRQSNGRYKKVSVGDKIDGGQVQAITANEVRYQKGGRLIALGMPKG